MALVVFVLDLVIGATAPATAIPLSFGQSTDQLIDRVGPGERAEPRSRHWDELNVANAFGARERHQDKAAHKVLAATSSADA